MQVLNIQDSANPDKYQYLGVTIELDDLTPDAKEKLNTAAKDLFHGKEVFFQFPRYQIELCVMQNERNNHGKPGKN